MAPLQWSIVIIHLSACALSTSTGNTPVQRSQNNPRIKSRNFDNAYVTYSVGDSNDVEVYRSDGIELNSNNPNIYRATSNSWTNVNGVVQGNENDYTDEDLNEQIPTYYSANHRYHPTTYKKEKDEHKGEVLLPQLSSDHPSSAASSFLSQAVLPGIGNENLTTIRPADSSLYTQAAFPGNMGEYMAANQPAASSQYTQAVVSGNGGDRPGTSSQYTQIGNGGGDLSANQPAASSQYTQALFPGNGIRHLTPNQPAYSSQYTQAVFPGSEGEDLTANHPAASSQYTQALFPGNGIRHLTPNQPAYSSQYTQAVFPGSEGEDLTANRPAASSQYTQALIPGNGEGHMTANQPAASSQITQSVFLGNFGIDLTPNRPSASSLFNQDGDDLATLGSDSGPSPALSPPLASSGYEYGPPPPPPPPPPTVGYDYLVPPSNQYLPATTAPPPPTPTVGYTYLRPPPSNEYLPATSPPPPPPPPPTGGYTYPQPPSNEYLPAPPPTAGYSYPPPPPSNQYLPVAPPPSTTTPAPSTTETEAPDAYTYYYLGTKLWYFPLFFTFYLSLYLAAVILQQWGRHDQRLPQHSFDAASTALADRRRRRLDVDRLADRVSRALASFVARRHSPHKH